MYLKHSYARPRNRIKVGPRCPTRKVESHPEEAKPQQRVDDRENEQQEWDVTDLTQRLADDFEKLFQRVEIPTEPSMLYGTRVMFTQ